MKHHRGTKENICDVIGCENSSDRSMPTGKIAEAIDEKLLEWDIGDPKRRTHLCKIHYKELKKITKSDRGLQRLGWGK